MELPLNSDGWKLIHFLKQECPSAYIAGGCLRDLDNNRPIKDVDVFVTSKQYSKVVTAGFSFVMQGNEYDGSVFTSYTYLQDNNLNLIKVNSELSLESESNAALYFSKNFDVGLCKIWLRLGGTQINKHPHYLKDKTNNTLTYYPSDSNLPSAAHSMMHLQRMSDKYKGWEVKIDMEERLCM